MKRTILVSTTLFFILAAFVNAQINLSYVSSRDVRSGYSVQTHVDSLLIDTRVNSGLAVTRLTMVMTPGVYYYEDYYISSDSIEKIKIPSARSFDSIEISMSFQLPTDFVADSMWLWVNGKPEAAYIQDRALASQQYQQIVGVRRDPALLETWGNSYYSLRIFPASSMKSRRIQIEFRHTFNDDSVSDGRRLITACIPITFDSTYVYYYNTRTSVFKKNIGFISARFSAEDNSEYLVDFPGVGGGSFSRQKELVIAAAGSIKLSPGAIVAPDPSGAEEFLWVGRDPGNDKMTAGVSVEMSDELMRFEPEPDTRIIILDIHNSVWDWNEYYRKRAEAYGYNYTNYSGYEKYNIWERAQKYAIIALQQYLTTGQKFNVLIGGKTVQQVFDAPVEAGAANIEQAIRAIIAATPSPESSTDELVERAVTQAPEGIAVLITDLIQPPNYQVRVDNKYVTSEYGAVYDTVIKRVAESVKKSAITLFTIDDNYQLLRTALESGGFRLSGILNRYNIAYSYKIVNGKRVTVPKLPDLFGSSNYSGIRNLTVTSDQLTDISYTIDGYNNGYYYVTVGEPTIMIDAMGKRLAKMALPSTYSNGNYLIRIAGKISIENSGKPVDISIRGKTGGLWFDYEVTAAGSYTPVSSVYRPFEDPQWAFRKSEQLGAENYIDNAAAIKKLGVDYHIVTRQTSLLALEPGMKLWEDSTWQQEQPSVTQTTGGAERVAMDVSYTATTKDGGAPTNTIGSGVSFDGISLEDIIAAGNSMAVLGEIPERIGEISVKASGKTVYLKLPSTFGNAAVTLRLYDLKGRLVAQKCIGSAEAPGATLQWNVGRHTGGLSRGLYTIHVSAGSQRKIFRITLMGN